MSASFSLSVICSLGSRKKCVVYHSTPQYNINHFSTLHLELHNNNNHLTVLKKQHRPVPFNSFCSMNLSAIKERRRGIGFSLMFYSVKGSISGDFAFMTREKRKEGGRYLLSAIIYCQLFVLSRKELRTTPLQNIMQITSIHWIQLENHNNNNHLIVLKEPHRPAP